MSTIDPVQVLIVEDHPDMRDSLAQALADHPCIASITCCPDLPQAQRHLNTHAPHLLLVDLGLTSGSGLSLIRKAQAQKKPRCTAAVLTVTGKEDDLLKAIRFGAKGYLFKSAPPSQWCATVHQLLHAQSPLHAAVAQAMLNAWAPAAPPAHLHPTAHQLVQHLAAGYWLQEAAQHLGLTPQQAGECLRQVYDSFYQPEAELPPRELELLELLSRGLTFKQAAQIMGVAEPTTKTLSTRAYQRLGATNLQMAIHEARQQGLLA